uniref:FAM192A/Fyv6 N-terminal domain-containing protein n=1 Tax=Mola mola TaxID=94237 RepID=A0A3Q3XN91_MOLML
MFPSIGITGGPGGKFFGLLDLSRRMRMIAELDEKRKKRQEEWEKVRKPDDPKEAPEEEYDPRSLFERLQEQKDKKQEEFEEQFKFMLKGLLLNVSRAPLFIPSHRVSFGFSTLTLYLHSALVKQASTESHKEPERKAAAKHSGAEQRTSHLSQAHLLAGAVKRRSSSQSSDSSKKPKVEITSATTTGNGERHTARTPSAPLSCSQGVLHLPSAAVCVGVLPGLCAYSGSSDSDSSSDSEGSTVSHDSHV